MRPKTDRASPASLHLALLRGINVGGRHRVTMGDLAAFFAEAGATEVRTYIRSGNVLFRTGSRRAREIVDLVHTAINERLGVDAPIITRTATALRAVARRHPFLEHGASASQLHVVFLASRPAACHAAALDPDRSPPDQFEVHGREIYLFCPDGVGRSKLTTAWFDARLKTTSTARNWRTVLELSRMAGEKA